MTSLARRFASDDDGQDLIEYCLLMAFVVLVAVIIFMNVGQSASAVWNSANNHLKKGHAYAKGQGN